MLLTKTNTFIIGPVATLLGFIMNAIFMFLDGLFGVQNIGLCIILFTIIIYFFMTPLNIKQQKFSKMSAKMNPEIQKIQKKYKGKQDQASMMKMNEETKAVYEKYGVSPTGSCLQLLIQMPILFALYRVIWNIPAYVDSVKEAFMPLVNLLLENADSTQSVMNEFATANQINFDKLGYTVNSIVDTLYKLKPADWTSLANSFPDMEETIHKTQNVIDGMNHFLGLNIGDSPFNIFMSGIQSGAILLAIGALLIPILSGVTQWLNVRLVSTANDTASQVGEGTMASSMKMMNNIMPLMSVVFCFTLPAGLGIYWVASSVVRSIQQLAINRHLDKVDMDEMIKKNMEKAAEKRKKKGLPPQTITNQAKVNTKNVETHSSDSNNKKKSLTPEERQKMIDKSTEYYKTHAAKPGSIASKARMVEQYNEKNGKK